MQLHACMVVMSLYLRSTLLQMYSFEDADLYCCGEGKVQMHAFTAADDAVGIFQWSRACHPEYCRILRAVRCGCFSDEHLTTLWVLCHMAGLGEIVRHHIFVGLADHTLVLVQHGTRLYLLNAQHLSHDMFYQQAGPLRSLISWSSRRTHGSGDSNLSPVPQTVCNDA